VHTSSSAGPAFVRNTYSGKSSLIDTGRGGPQVGAARMKGVDAARGIAMILVCVSHVRGHFADSVPELYSLLTAITRLATPTFLILSGFVAAYVLATHRSNARIALFDRGLFVLVVGHFLLNLGDLRDVDATQWIIGRVTVTDAIGLCLMSAVVLHKLPATALASLGAILAFLSWPIAMTLAIDSPIAGHVGAALFDLRSEANPLIDAAIVPYLGLFLIGMALSKHSLEDLNSRNMDSVARRLAVRGLSAIGIVVFALASWFALKSAGLTPTDPAAAELARLALDPRSKLPPGPSYLLFYGGGGLLLTAMCLIERPRALMRPLVQWASTLGRASLLCFVVQDWLLLLAPALFGFEDSTSVVFWLCYLCFALIVIHWLASRWDANGANRFLTFGLRHLARSPATRSR
jgi:uncharacterized membrane protein